MAKQIKEIKTISRNLRTNPEDDDSLSDPFSDELEVTSPSVLDTGSGLEEDGDNGWDEQDNEDDPVASLEKIPFAVLSKAQDSLASTNNQAAKQQKKRKRAADSDDKLAELRARLQELRQKRVKTEDSRSKSDRTDKAEKKASKSAKAAVPDDTDTDEDDGESADSDNVDEAEADSASGSDSDSDSGSDKGAGKKRRRSKHAPTEITSKKQVSRIGSVRKQKKQETWDPRFLPGVVGAGAPEAIAQKRYKFLSEYRQSEMNEIKSRLDEDKKRASANKKQRRKLQAAPLSAEDKATLERKFTRMKDQERSRVEKERVEDIKHEHMKKERDLVRAGKKSQPYFLKENEIKRLAVEKKFSEMKNREKEHALERRRKKMSSKEKKAMPADRRVVG